ncbi:B-box zinc finger protein 24-like isoform X1 [Lycium ferocissimum]|uniref:B-box zinc finger protein 24-like isoform X1 n=1 Tax=Lycium ferocissimum TaxID=112874 RepID=UPI00281583F0|nr:B-box zinc finger protein 24-like isoform X1 [Lycium ferocissimum]
MKIQCDVCEKAAATVICCADEAALCTKCDIEVHAANKLASKHQRLLLHSLSNKLPLCDICQVKTAFIFCFEDRALFCNECDEPIHSASSLSAKHQRFLATGIRVGLSSTCINNTLKSQMERQPPKQNAQQVSIKTAPQALSNITSPSWAVDDLVGFSEYESNHKKEQQLELGELEWLREVALCGERPVAEVPELCNGSPYRPTKFYYTPHKKPRIEIPDDDEYSTVPDLG